MSSDKKQRLIDAFERIKAGKPIRVEATRKLSPASVEDEAGVSRSLLRSYPDLFEEVVKEKQKLKLVSAISTSNDSGKLSSKIDDGTKPLKNEISKLKKELNELRAQYNLVLKYNAELTHIINTKRYNTQLDQLMVELSNQEQ